jgi:hypothetical protein
MAIHREFRTTTVSLRASCCSDSMYSRCCRRFYLDEAIHDLAREGHRVRRKDGIVTDDLLDFRIGFFGASEGDEAGRIISARALDGRRFAKGIR